MGSIRADVCQGPTIGEAHRLVGLADSQLIAMQDLSLEDMLLNTQLGDGSSGPH